MKTFRACLKKFLLAFGGGAGLPLIFIGTIAAQDLEAASVTEGLRIKIYPLPENIVTARKVEETSQEVPQQVTVFSEADIDQSRIDGLDDISLRTPSFEFVNTGTAFEAPLIMRGVGNFGTGEPSVGFLVDGIYMAADPFMNQDLHGIERIEVLKGPQNTLYGKSAIGGIVDVVSKPPSEEPEGEVQYSYGSGDRHRAAGGISGPIVAERVLARGSVSREIFGGYYSNANGESVDNDRHTSTRLSLLAMPTDSVEVTPTLHYRHQVQSPFPYRKTSSDRDYDGQAFNRNDPSEADIETISASLKVDYEKDPYAFTSISAWNHNDQTESHDLDYGPAANWYAHQDVEESSFSQELRLSREGNGRLSWLAGVYYYDLNDDYHTDVLAGGISGISAALTRSVTRARTYSAFGRADFDMTEALTLSGGLRFDHDVRSQGGPGVSKSGKVFNFWSPEVSVSYEVVPEKSVYGKWSRGHKPGGFNRSATSKDFDEETVHAWEAGFKSEWGKGLFFNGAAFLTNLKDQQVYSFDAATNSEITSNAGNARIVGSEIELSWRPSRDWTLGGAFTYTDAEFTDYSTTRTGPSGTQTYVLDGNALEGTPEYAAKLTADYTKPFGAVAGNDAEFLGHLEVLGWGKRYWDDFNFASQEPYQVINASAGVQVGKFRIRGYVNNLFDAKYFTNYVSAFEFPLAGGDNLGVRGQERTFGLEVTARF